MQCIQTRISILTKSKKTKKNTIGKCFEFHFMNQFNLVTGIEYFILILLHVDIPFQDYHIILLDNNFIRSSYFIHLITNMNF